MYKIMQYLIRVLLFLVFIAASPVMFLLSIPFTKTFSGAITDTIEVVISPLKDETYK